MANRYTIIREAEDAINQTAITTKGVIDNNLYDNDNQEITGDMNNEAVSTVTTMSRNNDLLFTNYLVGTDTRIAKATLYDSFKFEINDATLYKLSNNPEFAIFTIDIPAYTDVEVKFYSTDYAANSFVTVPTGSWSDGDTVFCVDMPNTEYSTLFPKIIKRYDLYGSTEGSRYYHWSNTGVMNYNVNFETRLVLCVKYNREWMAPDVVLNGEALPISTNEYGLVYLSEYHYDYNLEPKTVENSNWTTLNYAIAQRHDLDYSLSTRLKVWHAKLHTDTNNNYWEGGKDLIVIELQPYDTFKIQNVVIGESGLAVTKNQPTDNTPLDIVRFAPTPETMHNANVFTSLEYWPRDYMYADLTLPIEITNTASKPFYISFDLFKPDLTKAIFQVNGQDIFYPQTTTPNDNFIVDEYGNKDVLVNSSNVLFLKKQLTHMTALLSEILQRF